MLSLARRNLDGPAKDWNESRGRQLQQWNDWIRELRTQFRLDLTLLQWSKRCEEQTQQANERTTDYMHAKLRMISRCPVVLRERDKIDYITIGMTDTSIANSLKSHFKATGCTAYELVELARELDSIIRPINWAMTTNESQSSIQPSPTQDPEKKGPRCYRCNTFGHIGKDHDDPTKARTLPPVVRMQKPKDDRAPKTVCTASATSQHEMQSQHDRRPVVTVRINETEVKALLDSGADDTVIRHREARTMNLDIKPFVGEPYQVLDGDTIPIGRTSFPLTIGPITGNINAAVVRDAPYPVLVGIDWKEATNTAVTTGPGKRIVIEQFNNAMHEPKLRQQGGQIGSFLRREKEQSNVCISLRKKKEVTKEHTQQITNILQDNTTKSKRANQIRDEFFLKRGGVLCRNAPNKLGIRHKQIAIPTTLRDTVPEMSHDHEGHIDKNRTKSRIENRYWWKGTDKSIKEYVVRCPIGQRMNRRTSKPVHCQKQDKEAHECLRRALQSQKGRYDIRRQGTKLKIGDCVLLDDESLNVFSNRRRPQQYQIAEKRTNDIYDIELPDGTGKRTVHITQLRQFKSEATSDAETLTRWIHSTRMRNPQNVDQRNAPSELLPDSGITSWTRLGTSQILKRGRVSERQCAGQRRSCYRQRNQYKLWGEGATTPPHRESSHCFELL